MSSALYSDREKKSTSQDIFVKLMIKPWFKKGRIRKNMLVLLHACELKHRLWRTLRMVSVQSKGLHLSVLYSPGTRKGSWLLTQ